MIRAVAQVGSCRLLFEGKGRDLCPSFYDRVTRQYKAIQEMITDIPHQQLSLSQFIFSLQGANARLSRLSDGSYKLYLHFSLAGGMQVQELSQLLGIGDTSVTDAQVADNILEVVPPESYSWVTVLTLPEGYRFPATDAPKEARMIEVKPSNWQWFVNVVRALALAAPGALNGCRVMRAILGSGVDRDRQELIKACQRNYTIYIYISYDLESGHIQFIQDPYTRESACTLL